MGVNVDRFAPEAQQPLAITSDAETVIALMVAVAIQQIDFAQAVPGQTGQIVMYRMIVEIQK